DLSHRGGLRGHPARAHTAAERPARRPGDIAHVPEKWEPVFRKRTCAPKGSPMLSYLMAMTTFAAIYGVMALGLNVMWGMAGMVNLGVVGFFAVGAYSSALVVINLSWPI